CNGAAAAQAWRRHVQPRLSAQLCALPVVALPSTSPANAAWSLPRLAAAWQPLCDALR
ncbi:DNA-deoxyinosine glycosylase, partial [Xanthomonas perforans]